MSPYSSKRRSSPPPRGTWPEVLLVRARSRARARGCARSTRAHVVPARGACTRPARGRAWLRLGPWCARRSGLRCFQPVPRVLTAIAPGELQQLGRVVLFRRFVSYEAASGFCVANRGALCGQTVAGPWVGGLVTHRHPSLTRGLPLPRLSQLRAGALPRGLARGQAEDKRCLTAQAQTPRLKPRLCLMPAV